MNWDDLILSYKLVHKQNWEVLDEASFKDKDGYVNSFLDRKFNLSTDNIRQKYLQIKNKKLNYQRYFVINRITNYISKRIYDKINYDSDKLRLEFNGKSIKLIIDKDFYQIFYTAKYKQDKNIIKYSLEIGSSKNFGLIQEGQIKCR